MKYSPETVANCLEIAASEIDYAYQHGLHEHGIPVPRILRALRDSVLFMRASVTLDKEVSLDERLDQIHQQWQDETRP
jgi:hypothetical protein